MNQNEIVDLTISACSKMAEAPEMPPRFSLEMGTGPTQRSTAEKDGDLRPREQRFACPSRRGVQAQRRGILVNIRLPGLIC